MLGTTLTWALVWLPIGLLLTLVFGSPKGCLFCAPHWRIWFMTIWIAWGGLSGAVFSIVLSLAERRRTLAELSLGRTAVWGALGALLLPLAITLRNLSVRPSLNYDWMSNLIILAVAAAMGAGCAMGTLALARR